MQPVLAPSDFTNDLIVIISLQNGRIGAVRQSLVLQVLLMRAPCDIKFLNL